MITASLNDIAQALGIPFPSHDKIFTGVSIDSRQILPGNLFIAITGENFDGHAFVAAAKEAGAVAAIVEHHVDSDLPTLMVADTRLALGKIAQWYRAKFDIPLIGLTGSCGKTTTKTLLASILNVRGSTLATAGTLNNDLGVPLTLFNLRQDHQFAVIEMGANHHGEIAYLAGIAKPTHALITNAAPVHLEGFGSIEGVARAKGEIYQALSEDGVAIINQDDAYADFWSNLAAARKKWTFGSLSKAEVWASDVVLREDGGANFVLHYQNDSTLISLPILGQHNVLNAVAAATAAFSLGLTLSEIRQGLEKAPAVEKRSIRYTGYNGVEIIDDSYNANPTAFKAAIDLLKNLSGNSQRYLVMGDMAELGENALYWHAEVGRMAFNAGLDGLFTVGKMSEAASQAFGGNAQHFANQAEMIASLREKAAQNITLLVKGSKSSKMGNIVQALLV